MKAYKLLLVLFIFSAFLIVKEVFDNETKKNQIEKNKEQSIAKVIDVINGSGKGGLNGTRFDFYHNGSKYVVFEKSLRLENTNIGEFYNVEFDKKDPNTAVFLTKTKPLNPLTLIKRGLEIDGLISDIKFPFNSYADLYITYEYDNLNFSLRTRKHIDSLPCNDISKCKGSRIKLTVNPYYPEINNLYYESYDRQKLSDNLK